MIVTRQKYFPLISHFLNYLYFVFLQVMSTYISVIFRQVLNTNDRTCGINGLNIKSQL